MSVASKPERLMTSSSWVRLRERQAWRMRLVASSLLSGFAASASAAISFSV